MSFVEIVEIISEKVSDELERKYNRLSINIPFHTKLSYAIQLWCSELKIDDNITNYINQGYQLEPVKGITEFFWKEAISENKNYNIQISFWQVQTFTIKNQFYQWINYFLNKMNIRIGDMKLIAVIAFGVTAVGYWLYIISRQKQPPQQQPSRQVPKQYAHTDNPSSSSVQVVTKKFLVLVISASHTDFLESLKAKKVIDINDAERLYKVTKYLWVGSESSFKQKQANFKNYSVFPGKESEYDINLVYIELKQNDEGFKPNINQLDRYDAFRKLPGFRVNFDISPRLQMEAYENFEVYNR